MSIFYLFGLCGDADAICLAAKSATSHQSGLTAEINSGTELAMGKYFDLLDKLNFLVVNSNFEASLLALWEI